MLTTMTAAAPRGFEGGTSNTCEVRQTSPRRFTASLSGNLNPGWAGRLAAGLSSKKINIIRGEARKGSARTWEATFDIETLDATVDPTVLDLVGMAQGRETAAGTPAAPMLHSFRMERRFDALTVWVEAPDSVGFLERILRVFAFYSLFPYEMKVETAGSRVADTFSFRSLGGMAPSAEVADAVERKLRELVA